MGRLAGVTEHRLPRIAFAGATSAAVDFVVFNLVLIPLDGSRTEHLVTANTVAFLCAMIVNYSLNARLSFRVRMTRRSLVAYAGFTAIGLLFYNVNLLWIRALLGADTPIALNVSKLAAMGLLVVWNYVGYQRFVFGPDARPARERAE